MNVPTSVQHEGDEPLKVPVVERANSFQVGGAPAPHLPDTDPPRPIPTPSSKESPSPPACLPHQRMQLGAAATARSVPGSRAEKELANIQAGRPAEMLHDLQDSFEKHGVDMRQWEWDFRSLPPVVVVLGRAHNAVLAHYEPNVSKKKRGLEDMGGMEAAKKEGDLKEKKVDGHEETINKSLVIVRGELDGENGTNVLGWSRLKKQAFLYFTKLIFDAAVEFHYEGEER
ncbi:hypothetical protein BDY21DRAFT_337707 [Lineolata rhizophorae]|uniref:Uncharacterized protein n=1 Tax=Lineolata rhizophorae TaxID=578093 RepID=A0A6A6P874_9PEZI|nr:hypothetical protein BDY21DRAFT_337707 [Lineolata rhizophorae]